MTGSQGRPRALAVVQARMTSSRLPGKVLADLAGRPALGLLLERLARSTELDGVVVATSVEESDDPVAELVRSTPGVELARGPLSDVLERYRLTLATHPCDAVVRITADCPLMDPTVVDCVVDRWRTGAEQYVTNVIEPRSFPVGMDVEVVAADALRAAASEATEPHDREHVTPFVRARPQRFPQARVERSPAAGDIRIVLDTPQDLASIRELVERSGPNAGMEELLAAMAD